jgi:hypothetical protein
LAVFDAKNIPAGLPENPVEKFPRTGIVIGYEYLHG